MSERWGLYQANTLKQNMSVALSEAETKRFEQMGKRLDEIEDTKRLRLRWQHAAPLQALHLSCVF